MGGPPNGGWCLLLRLNNMRQPSRAVRRPAGIFRPALHQAPADRWSYEGTLRGLSREVARGTKFGARLDRDTTHRVQGRYAAGQRDVARSDPPGLVDQKQKLGPALLSSG